MTSETQLRLEAMLSRAGGFFREGTALVANCPRCGKQKLHFRVSVPDAHRGASRRNGIQFRFSCFSKSCDGWNGKPEFALAEMLDQPVRAIGQELWGRGSLGGFVPRTGDGPKFEVDLDQPLSAILPQEQAKPMEWPGQFYPLDHPAAERGAAYMEGRGIPVEVARRYGVRYSVVHRSVAFPVEQRGVLWGWQLRLVIPHVWTDEDGVRRESNKATTAPGMTRIKWMFSDRLEGSDSAFVLEGPVDAIKADLCGGNVASMGAIITPGLIQALAAYPWRRLYVGLDVDAAKEARRLIEEFDQAVKYAGREVYLVEWPKRKDASGKQVDAGALSFEEVRECWRAAKRASSSQLWLI